MDPCSLVVHLDLAGLGLSTHAMVFRATKSDHFISSRSALSVEQIGLMITNSLGLIYFETYFHY